MVPDGLVDIINAGGDGEKYLIWLDGMTVDMKANPRAGSFGAMKSSAHSGTSSITHVANFLEDVEQSAFSHLFQKPLAPTGQSSVKDEGLMPAEIWSFPFEMTLMAPKERTEQ